MARRCVPRATCRLLGLSSAAVPEFPGTVAGETNGLQVEGGRFQRGPGGPWNWDLLFWLLGLGGSSYMACFSRVW